MRISPWINHMRNNKIVEPIGFVIAAIVFAFSLILFYSDNGMFLGSFLAALMSAALIWGTYLALRLVWLAMRK